ncbi:hypothetical protein KQX54_017116 [Cotesia glomerata]|uniref:Single domain-containing protein n=1 Tax=Cotesia glomerata TaxID=32391 RepID=A0AAV7HXW7_COTGL|nr:hypothetical protein KQX54_017116 [Cotesia glomerata]
MKIFAGFVVCLLIIFLWIESDASCFNTHDGKRSRKTFKTNYKLTDQCVEYTCNANGEWSIKGCYEWVCKRRVIGYETANFSKPFPYCCGYPICD